MKDIMETMAQANRLEKHTTKVGISWSVTVM